MKRWLLFRIFLAFFITLFGLSIMTEPSLPEKLAGCILAAMGFTVLFVAWLYSKRE